MAIQQKNISFSKPTIGKEEIDAVSKVLKSGWLAAGKETEAFEKEFAKYVGVEYAIFTNSCTSALKMAYKYAKEELGLTSYMLYDENTFCATYAAAEEMGLHRWRKKRCNCYKTVSVVVNYGGKHYFHPDNSNLFKITDSAHRIEKYEDVINEYEKTAIDGKYYDNADITCYSFYATKNMTTGSGGMFTTNNKENYEKARLYWKDGLSTSTHQRLKGKGWNYKVKAMAGGYDGNDLLATIGRVQLKKLPQFTKRRNEIVSKYNTAFGQEWTGNHLYPYFVKSEKEVAKFITYMSKNGISCGYHYPGTGWLGVSLPLYPLLTDKEVEYIIRKVKEYEL